MSAIRLVAGFPSSFAAHAEFRVHQGDHQIARVVAHAGGNIAVPTGPSEFAAQASMSMGEFTLFSNEVYFDETSITLVAELLEEGGFYDFRLIKLPGTEPDRITFENRCETPIAIKLWKPQSPFLMRHVVNGGGVAGVGSAQRWSVHAVVNGITSAPVVTTNPNATITVAQGSNVDNFTLVVS